MIAVKDIYWAAGFLEGEGSFFGVRGSPGVVASQVQKEPLERLKGLFGGAIKLNKLRDSPRHKAIWTWYRHSSEAIGIMMTVYAIMSAKRKLAISKCIAVWKTKPIRQKDRTHCPRGHKYSRSNTIINKKGWRMCSECNRTLYRNLYQPKGRRRRGADESQLALPNFLPVA